MGRTTRYARVAFVFAAMFSLAISIQYLRITSEYGLSPVALSLIAVLGGSLLPCSTPRQTRCSDCRSCSSFFGYDRDWSYSGS